MLKKVLTGVLVLVLLIVGFGLFRTFQVPVDQWSITGTFPHCPERPSCVSSIDEDDMHAIAPLGYPGPDLAVARAKVEEVIRAMPNTEIVMATPEYLHVVFQTPLMHFHDDVELLVQPAIIQVRSISRFGYGDHGVNRARVEAIRAAFNEKYTVPAP